MLKCWECFCGPSHQVGILPFLRVTFEQVYRIFVGVNLIVLLLLHELRILELLQFIEVFLLVFGHCRSERRLTASWAGSLRASSRCPSLIWSSPSKRS